MSTAPCLMPWDLSEPDRDAPSAALIERLRLAYPTEREVDANLTRKLQRRAGPAFNGAGFEAMSGYIAALLQRRIEGPFSIADPRWLSGGASKIQMAFTLHWNEPGVGATATRLVARMEPAESLNATSRRREFELLRAFAGVVPVPRVYWMDPDGECFPEPALIYAFAAGSTKPRAAQGKVAGIGTNFGPGLRERLKPPFIAHLAAIHRFDPARAAFESFDRPAVGTTQSALWQLNRARRIWEEDRATDLPLMEVAASWLERELPLLDHVSVVHGDYRSGNFLYDEDSLQITAVLDWERSTLGDRHRDLAWTANPAFGSLHEDGRTFLASGLIEREAFFERYERQSGLGVDPARLRYYTVFNSYQLVISALASAPRVVHLGKSHQDILLASAEPVGYRACAELRRCLEACL